MSAETMTWLNTMTLIGNTDQRGTAWHYRADEQGAEPNHYPGAIPVSDVQRRLFSWSAESRRVAVEIPATIETMTHTDDAGQPLRWEVQEGRQAITASDDHSVLGLFKTGYQAHQYEQWLLRNVATLLDDDLVISSAGLLRGRAVAWVEISVPDTITSPEGVTFRPNLLACTSFDGSLATTYKRTIQNTVCDNTMAVALEEKGQTVKIRHSSKSLTRVADVREALALVHTAADTFQAQVAALTSQAVTDTQFQQIVEALVPIAPDAAPRAVTMAENKRGELNRMYRWDPRAASFHGTAYGVLQAVNTWHHHEQGGLSGRTSEQKRQARADRNALRAVTGEIEALDNEVHRAIQKVLTGA